MIAFTTTPILHQNKPARESIICGKVGDWRTKRALIMLKPTPKTRQKQFCCIHAHGQRHRKHLRLQPQHERLQSMLLMANEDSIMQTQK